MKKSFKKSLMILLSIIMVFTMVTPVAFANEAVSITFVDSDMESASAGDGLKVTNLVNTGNGTTVEGKHIPGGIITFNFSEEMDITTLTPENITITLGANTYISASNPKFNSATMQWSYEPYEVTSTSYSIAIADMCEGTMTHTVTFTDGVKTANQSPITEVTKKFQTGRIATTQSTEGKVIKDVAYGKETKRHNADGSTTDRSQYVRYVTDLNQGEAAYTGTSADYIRIDLGNYYTIYDVITYSFWGATPSFNAHWNIDILYSNDPNADASAATRWGALGANQWNTSSSLTGSTGGGRGLSRYLSPSAPVRARYIFLRVTSSAAQYGEQLCSVKVLAEVDTDYGAITATKDGNVVTAFTGAGEYVVSVPVTEYVSGSSAAYMIVAGYDASGVITKINCAPVSKSDNKLTLATTFTDSTKTVKAALIKDFTKPQMLTDALVLETAQN